MRRLAKLAPDGLSATYATADQLKAEFPDRMFSRQFGAAQLEGTGYVLVDEGAPPIIGFGDDLVLADAPAKTNGSWQEVWTVVPHFTLAQAKTELGRMACEVYHAKVILAPFTPAELQASGSATGVITARAGRFDQLLADIAARIAAASTKAAAYAIYQELEEAS